VVDSLQNPLNTQKRRTYPGINRGCT